MKAIVVHQSDGNLVLDLEEIADVSHSADEVLVDIKATADKNTGKVILGVG